MSDENKKAAYIIFVSFYATIISYIAIKLIISCLSHNDDRRENAGNRATTPPPSNPETGAGTTPQDTTTHNATGTTSQKRTTHAVADTNLVIFLRYMAKLLYMTLDTGEKTTKPQQGSSTTSQCNLDIHATSRTQTTA